MNRLTTRSERTAESLQWGCKGCWQSLNRNVSLLMQLDAKPKRVVRQNRIELLSVFAAILNTTNTGQITLPEKIQQYLKLISGSRVELVIDPDS